MRFTHRTTTTPVLQTDSAAGLASRTEHRRGHWPHRRHIGAGTVLRVAFLASFGALTFRVSFAPVYVTLIFRRNMNDQRRRVWPIIHTVADIYRCHDGTSTVLQLDGDRCPTVLLGLSSQAIGTVHRRCRRRMLQNVSGRSALGRIHKRDASRKHLVSRSRSPSFIITNFLPRRT